MKRTFIAVLLCTAVTGCVRDNPDSRLDEDRAIDPRELGAMLKLDCSQRREEVQLARDDSQSDFDRLANYRLALKAYSGAAEKIEAAFTKEPDMLYLAEGDSLRLLLQKCQTQARTFTDELRKFELAVQFNPKPVEAEAKAEAKVEAKETKRPEPAKADVKAASAADEAFDTAPTKKMKSSKKSKKKTALALAKAKRKKAGRAHAVLADASH